MKRLFAVLSLLLLGWAAPTTAQIPSTLFGLHDDWANVTPEIPYGTARLWDNDVRWDNLWQSGDCIPGQIWGTGICSAANNDWHWGNLDNALMAIHTQCPNCDVVYTFGGVAAYANGCNDDGSDYDSTHQCARTLSGGGTGRLPNGKCGNTRPWGCWLPPDINADGSGTDKFVTDYFTFLATHVNGLKSNNYAHILYWDLFNEYDRDPCLNSQYASQYCPSSTSVGGGNTGAGYMVIATYAQMQRMFFDMRATIAPIITGAKFSEGNTSGRQAGVLQNIMYCNNSPSTTCGCPSGAQTGCSGQGSGHGLSASGLVDIVGWHDYRGDGTGQGEQIADGVTAMQAALTMADQTIPEWVTETSFYHIADLPDFEMMAGFAAREMLTCASSGLTRCYWYRYDGDHCHDQYNGLTTTGDMYDSADAHYSNGDFKCTNGPVLWWDGKAYKQMYNWLVGSTLASPACTSTSLGGGDYTVACNLTSPLFQQEQIVWLKRTITDKTSWCSGSGTTRHGSCDFTSYSCGSFGHYQTLDPDQGNQTCSGTVKVTGQPILLTP